jgi:hypothetical protein
MTLEDLLLRELSKLLIKMAMELLMLKISKTDTVLLVTLM